MAINSTQTTRARRGMGAQTGHNNWNGTDYNNCKEMHLVWSAVNNELIVPGEGGVPRGVLDMALTMYSDNQEASITFNGTNWIVAATNGPYDGTLHIWYKS